MKLSFIRRRLLLLSFICWSFQVFAWEITDHTSLEPLGFSKNGIFAYRILDSDCKCKSENCQKVDSTCMQSEDKCLVTCNPSLRKVIDLKTDQLVIPKSGTNESSLGINLGDLKIEKFPLKNHDDSLQIEHSKGCEDIGDLNNLPQNKQYECVVFLKNSVNKKKEIYKFHSSVRRNFELQINKFIRSPYESRVALILETRSAAYEDDYSFQREIIGASLKNGFK